MPFNVPQEDHTMLSPLHCFKSLHLWTWPLFDRHPLYQSKRLAIELLHAHQLSAEVLKKSMRHVGTIALVFLRFLPLRSVIFFFPP